MADSPAPEQAYGRRIEALRLAMHRQGRRAPLDAFVVSDLTNIGYLSGFAGSAAVVVFTESEAIFITDGRYISTAAQDCPGFRIVEARGSGGYVEALASVLSERKSVRRVGFESAHVTVEQLRAWRKSGSERFRWVAASGFVERLRLIKDAGEVERIRAAVRIAEGAFAAVQENLRPGVSERDFALELEFTMRRMGADAPSFDTIVASGPNGAYPHHHPGDRPFEAGDLVTIDWGARKDGYCSDITRTVAVAGKPVDSTLRKIHRIVLGAKERACEACVAGASGQAVDAIARDLIKAAGYGDEFKHGLGHSLGRDVHDGMTVSQRAAGVVLREGMVTTVEPGIYIDGLGGVRIEEDVLVTEAGPVILTSPSLALEA